MVKVREGAVFLQIEAVPEDIVAVGRLTVFIVCVVGEDAQKLVVLPVIGFTYSTRVWNDIFPVPELKTIELLAALVWSVVVPSENFQPPAEVICHKYCVAPPKGCEKVIDGDEKNVNPVVDAQTDAVGVIAPGAAKASLTVTVAELFVPEEL
jgi:hypothetical protein